MYRRNTANQHLGFVLVSTSDGSPILGATVTVYRVLDGATQVTAAGIVQERGHGQYDFAPSAADLNCNQGSFLFLATGAVPVEKTVITTAADPTDPTFGILGAVPDVRDLSTVTTPSVGDCLAAAFAEAAGPESIVGTAYTKKIGAITVRNFTLNDPMNPTARS